MQVKCYNIFLKNNELDITQYPELIVNSTLTLNKELNNNNIKYSMTDQINKEYIFRLQLFSDFNHITLLKFPEEISMITADFMNYIPSSNLFINLSFFGTLRLIKQANAVYNLKSFW